MNCVPVAFGLCYTANIFIALFIFLLAGLAWYHFRHLPQPYFNGKVTVQLKGNFVNDFTENVEIFFHQPGRYQISFVHPHYTNGPDGAGINQTKLVKHTPDSLVITEKWFPRPLTIVIEHDHIIESHKFN